MQTHNHENHAAAPIVAWPGGKRRLLPHILPLIEASPHRVYVEPFGGGASVLLAKHPATRLEVLNDINGDLINLYRCARWHTRELLRLVRAMPSGRAVFREVRDSRPETDLLRAARYFYLLKCSTFGQGHSWLNSPMPRALGRRLVAFRRRMERVILECRPAEELLTIYDSPKTLFFLDPPYVGTGKIDSYDNYTPAALEALANQVRALKGRFILTIDDRPEHRALFEGYAQIPVTTAANMRPGHTFSELLIHNIPTPVQTPCSSL